MRSEKGKHGRQSSKTLGATVTGEPYQPARIYFETSERAVLERAFEKMKCMDDDSANERWVWLWSDEAKRVQLGIPRAEIARELHPIVIGEFRFPRSGGVHLDLRSLLRVTAALGFFRGKVPDGDLRPRRLCVVNRLFEVQERPGPIDHGTHDHFFEKSSFTVPPADLAAENVRACLRDASCDPETRLVALEEVLEASGGLALPEVEQIPLDESEPGWLDSLVLALRIRVEQALAAWQGHSTIDWSRALRKPLDLRAR